MEFQLFRFPVRVDFTFFIMAMFLGMSRFGQPAFLLSWIAVVFFSVLIHELGHALVARSYGSQPAIRLYAMGGLTIWQSPWRISHHQRIWLSFAGPLAGFIVAALVWVLKSTVLPPLPVFGMVLLNDLLWVNLVWGAINLLPILPMDGGNIMRSTIQMLTRSDDLRIPVFISMAFCSLALVFSLYHQYLWATFLCGWFLYHNYMLLNQGEHNPS